MSKFETLEVHLENKLLEVALNRQDVHNAFNRKMISELTDLFQSINQDGTVRAVVLTGRGRTFCAGADLGMMEAASGHSFEENIAESRSIYDLMFAVDSCSKPVVGRINGSAVGGGLGDDKVPSPIRRCRIGRLLPPESLGVVASAVIFFGDDDVQATVSIYVRHFCTIWENCLGKIADVKSHPAGRPIPWVAIPFHSFRPARSGGDVQVIVFIDIAQGETFVGRVGVNVNPRPISGFRVGWNAEIVNAIPTRDE